MFRLDDVNGVQYPAEVLKEFIPEDTRPAFPQSPQIRLSRIREPVKKKREILQKWVTLCSAGRTRNPSAMHILMIV